MDKVIFNEDRHEYKNEGTNKRYTSATQLISKFKQPFDKEKVAKAYALKNGGTAEEWIAKWAQTSKIACDKGTAFHKKKEDAMLANSAIIKEDNRVSEVHSNEGLRSLYNFDYSNIPDGIYPEMLVFNHYFEIAGQVDIPEFDGSYFDVDDYKTNKKIDLFSFHHPKTGYKKMKFPLNHLMDCNYTHYALQLSLYAFMIEDLTGKKPRSLCFHHHPPKVDNPSEAMDEGIRYDVPYLRNEVLAMLAVHTGKDISQYK